MLYWIPEIEAYNERKKAENDTSSRKLRSSFKKMMASRQAKSAANNNNSSSTSKTPNGDDSTRYTETTIPTILVSTKIDLRDQTDSSNQAQCVSYDDGERLKDQIGAKCFIECSALTQENIKAVFDNALLVFLQNNPDMVTNNSKHYLGGDPENVGTGLQKKTNTQQNGNKKRCGPCASSCVIS